MLTTEELREIAELVSQGDRELAALQYMIEEAGEALAVLGIKVQMVEELKQQILAVRGHISPAQSKLGIIRDEAFFRYYNDSGEDLLPNGKLKARSLGWFTTEEVEELQPLIEAGKLEQVGDSRRVVRTPWKGPQR